MRANRGHIGHTDSAMLRSCLRTLMCAGSSNLRLGWRRSKSSSSTVVVNAYSRHRSRQDTSVTTLAIVIPSSKAISPISVGHDTFGTAKR